MAPRTDSLFGNSPPALPEASRHEASQLFFRKLLILLGTLAVLALLYAVRRLLLMLGFAVLFAYVVEPLVALVERAILRWNTSQARLLAVTVVYLGSIAGLVAAGSLLLPGAGRQLQRLSVDAPAIASEVQVRLERGLEWYRSRPMPGVVRDALDHLVQQAGPATTAFVAGLALRLTAVAAYLPWLVLVPVMAFLLLKDAASFQALLVRLMPSGRSRWRVADFLSEINQVLAAYVRVQLLVAVIVAIGSGLLLGLCGVPFWLLLAGAAAILEFIPVLGPATFVVAAGLIARGEGRAIPVVAGLILLRMAIDYLISPALIRRGLKLHPLAILLALLCGAQLAGIAGLFLAIPLMAVGVVTYRFALLQSGATGLLASLIKTDEPSGVPALQLSSRGESRELGEVGEQGDVSLDGVRVLVVDNEIEARETVSLALQGYGASVLEADSGASAIELLQSGSPDVLLSDIGMPQQDGLDLIRALRSLSSASRNIPAIALTGYASSEDRDRILAAGFQLYLRKPVASEELGRAVRQLVAAQRNTDRLRAISAASIA